MLAVPQSKGKEIVSLDSGIDLTDKMDEKGQLTEQTIGPDTSVPDEMNNFVQSFEVENPDPRIRTNGIFGYSSYDAVKYLVSANPAAQIAILMDGAGGSFHARAGLSNLNFVWPDSSSSKVWPTTGLVLIYMLIYTVAGVLFAWRAKCRFRRNVF